MLPRRFAVVSAVIAATALASAAHAGGGVRLGFGGPLGTFVATPSHGGAAPHAKAAKPKKVPPAKAIVRKHEKQAPRLVKAQPPKKAAAPKAAVAAHEPDRTSPAPVEQAAPVTGSSVLIQQSIPAQAPEEDEPAAAEAPAARPAVAASTHADEDGESGCKKFIPAVGMTVSVGCGD